MAASELKTCRARVWQENWAPMPWDYCRRTPYTETMRFTLQNTHSNRWRCKQDADAYEHIKSPKDRARIGSEPLPWNHRKRVHNINKKQQIHSGSLKRSTLTHPPQNNPQDDDDADSEIILPAVIKPTKSPRDLPTCRARVWQEGWEPMPWDDHRRTMWTETRGHGCGRYEESKENRWAARQNRYRQYQVHFYGSPGDKETKNSYLRTCLKQQLSQVEPPHKQFVKLIGESLAVAEKTRAEEEKEREKNAKHRQFLSEFKDNNKMTMDMNVQKEKQQRQLQAEQEKQKLSLNPINWSYSLW